MKKIYDYEVEVIYRGSSSDKMNARLDFCAEQKFGHFLSFDEYEEENICIRVYGFDDDNLVDDFREESNLIISRYFGFEPILLNQMSERIVWTFEEAVYHHVEFEDEKTATNFATAYRAVLATYLEPGMFDMMIVKPSEETDGYLVIWAFPMEGVISLQTEDEDEVLKDAMDVFNTKQDKKKVMN